MLTFEQFMRLHYSYINLDILSRSSPPEIREFYREQYNIYCASKRRELEQEVLQQYERITKEVL